MKILVIQDFLRSGGTERQSILLANAFAAAGHAVTLLTFRPGGALEPTVARAVVREALQPFDLKLDWFAPGVSSRVRQLAPNVVLCMGRMANCYAGQLQLEHPATTVVATMRTGKKLPTLFQRSLRIVPQVVANSRDARETLIREYAVSGDKISVIYNSLVFPAATSTANALAGREAFRARHDASPSAHVLVCVAMFRPEKNQRGLIEAVGALPPEIDWQLWLAGEGPARGECEAIAAARNLSGRIKFLGFQRDPSALYAAADIAVHASGSEALSNFLIEAQAHGLPAVVYQAQGMEECFVPGETGWAVPRGDDRAFQSRLLALMTEPEASRRSRADAARRYARETFDPDRQVESYLHLFQRLTPRSVK